MTTPLTPASGPASDAIATLRSSLGNRVITPDDDRYAAMHQIAIPDTDPRPAAIVRVVGAEDIARVVEVARTAGLPLAVRSGGHSLAGHGAVDDGLVIDLRDMTALEIDSSQRTAWAETGLTAGAYLTAAAEHGLVTGFGDTASVGIGGITLGGGVGYLSRLHGLTIDSLLAAEVITADGSVLRVDETSHPDLFWAIRGGGGNFGVATRFQFRMVPLAHVFGGMLLLPATAETLAGFIAAAEEADDALGTIATVMPCPPMPFVPEEHHGSLIIMSTLCYAGDAADGERAVAPFRALATPLADMVTTMPYLGLYPPEEPESDMRFVGRMSYADRIGIAEAERIIEALAASDAPIRMAQLRVLGGAIGRVPAEATAYAHRDGRILTFVGASYEDDAERPAREAWTRDLSLALGSDENGAYVNFLGDEGEARVRAAYPGATWDRLAAVKARYDPENLFRLNQNVPPALDDPLFADVPVYDGPVPPGLSEDHDAYLYEDA